MNGSEWIAERYRAIIVGLDEVEIAAIWAAALFGRRPVVERLRGRLERLEELRDDVGRSSAERSRVSRGHAA